MLRFVALFASLICSSKSSSFCTGFFSSACTIVFISPVGRLRTIFSQPVLHYLTYQILLMPVVFLVHAINSLQSFLSPTWYKKNDYQQNQQIEQCSLAIASHSLILTSLTTIFFCSLPTRRLFTGKQHVASKTHSLRNATSFPPSITQVVSRTQFKWHKSIMTSVNVLMPFPLIWCRVQFALLN